MYWCLHCECVIVAQKRPEACLHRGCDGGFLDIWDWADVRDVNPSYPELPEHGGYYPLYGPDE